MTNLKTAKKALLSSVIALLVCFTMLLGTTFAWFTDSVTSTNNVIKSGTLNVEMYYADGSKAVPTNDGDWKNAQGVALYTADQLWEPGYTDAKHIKIANEGTLALKYQLAIIPTGEVSILADVIDVYLYEKADTDDNATQVETRDDIDATMYVGTLADVINKGIVQGTLAAKANYTTTIVLKMKETADNKYQGLSIGDDFTIQLLATQLDAEKDSFGPDYDEDAWTDGMLVYSESDLNAAIANGANVVLGADVELQSSVTVDEGMAININLNGKKLSANLTTTEGAVLINNGTATISNGTIASTAVNGSEAVVNNGTMVLDDVTIYGAPMDTTGYPAYAVGTSGKLTIEEGTKVYADRGAIRTSDGAELIINGGEFIVSDAADGRNMMNHVVYAYGKNTTVTIRGGYFEYNHTSTGGASVVCPYYATIEVYGGDFRDAMDDSNWTSVGNFQNYMGTKDPVVYGGTYDDQTVLKHVADGFKAVESNGVYYVVPDGVNAVITADDLVALGGTKINGTYMLMADLDMSGKVMKSMEVSGGASVNFIGNGHTISNLTLNAAGIHGMTGASEVAGLFDLTAPADTVSLTVNDLAFANATVACSKYAATVVGYNPNGGTAITLNNVDVAGATVTAESVAALVGYTTGALTMTDCDVSDLTLSGEFSENKVGAYVGTVNTATGAATVTNCTNATTYGDYGRVINGAKWNGAVVVSASAQTDFTTALSSNNAVNITLAAGNYTMPAGLNGSNVSLQGKTVTISGTKDTVIDATTIFENDQFATNATIVFDGVTVNFGTAQNMGFANTKSLTYRNCKINGLQFLYGENVVFENCVFDANGAEHCVWTYGAQNVSFTECSFNYGDRCVNVFGYGRSSINLNFDGCTFATENTASKGAVEINSSAFPQGANVSFVGCTAPAYGTMVGISGWDGTNGASANITVDGDAFTAPTWPQ